MKNIHNINRSASPVICNSKNNLLLVFYVSPSSELIDGHNFEEILSATKNPSGKPKLIIADTVKGRGVTFMEDDNNWHYRIPSSAEVFAAKLELAV